MSKPRLCEILGVELNEKFEIEGYRGQFYVGERGAYYLQDGDDRPMWITATTLVDVINHPERVVRKNHWTEDDIADAKAIKRIWPDAAKVWRYHCGSDSKHTYLCVKDGNGYTKINFCRDEISDFLPSVNDGETVTLDEILEGEK